MDGAFFCSPFLPPSFPSFLLLFCRPDYHLLR
jgi:hypothetical protein